MHANRIEKNRTAAQVSSSMPDQALIFVSHHLYTGQSVSQQRGHLINHLVGETSIFEFGIAIEIDLASLYPSSIA